LRKKLLALRKVFESFRKFENKEEEVIHHFLKKQFYPSVFQNEIFFLQKFGENKVTNRQENLKGF
jgi:hypothetical protein